MTRKTYKQNIQQRHKAQQERMQAIGEEEEESCILNTNTSFLKKMQLYKSSEAEKDVL